MFASWPLCTKVSFPIVLSLDQAVLVDKDEPGKVEGTHHRVLHEAESLVAASLSDREFYVEAAGEFRDVRVVIDRDPYDLEIFGRENRS